MSTSSVYNLAIIINESRRGSGFRDSTRDAIIAKNAMGQFKGGAEGAANANRQLDESSKRTAATIKNVLAASLLIAGAAVVKFAKEGFQEFAQFDQKMAETYALMPNASESLKQNMRDDIRVVGVEMGRLTDETVPALYQALSAGVPEWKAAETVKIGAKAATAGAASLEQTMKLGLAIVNAYGGEIYTLTDAYDIMFKLVDLGIPRIEDWNATMQNVTSIASESRTPFEDIAAALAVMTRQGDSAAEATELLGFLLMQLGISGTAAATTFMEATGQSYRQWIQNGNGLIEGLIAMDDHAKSTGKSIADMIAGDSKFFRDQQAARGALELTGIHMQELIDLSNEIRTNYSGAMGEAFTTASDNAQYQVDQMKAGWENLKITIGEVIWTQDVFWFRSGKEMTEYITNFVKMISQTWEAPRGDNTPLHGNALITQIERLMEIEGKMKGIGLGEAWTAQIESNFMRLAELTPNLGVFMVQLEMLDATSKNFWENETERVIKGTDLNVYSLHHRAQKGLELAEALKEQADQEHRAWELTNLLTEANMTAGANMSPLISQWEALNSGMEGVTNMSFDWPFDPIPAEEVASLVRIIEWIPISTKKMSDQVASYFADLKAETSTLFDARDELAEAAQGWQDIIVNNQWEINQKVEELAGDLTETEKEAMYDILNSAQEGGSEWLEAWKRLQTDLTDTQRNETIARLAELTAEEGARKQVWAGDKEAAIDAAGVIMDQMEAIEQTYLNLAQTIAAQKFMERFGEQTYEAQLSALELEKAMGLISEPEYLFLKNQLDQAQTLETIMNTMLDDYIAEGPLAEEQANNIAKAIEVINTNTGDLTDEGIAALLDKILADSGGFPEAGLVVKGVGEEVTTLHEETNKYIDDGPYVAEFEANTVPFYSDYDDMLTAVNAALGPWKVQFEAEYNFPPMPSPPGSSDTKKPNAGHASGIRNKIVPSGFPNDSYLVGLTSGEEYSVWRPGERQREQASYQDNRRQTIIINNNTRAAAKLAQAQLQTLTRKRVQSYVGG